MTQTSEKIDTQTLKSNVDLITLAGRHSTLGRESRDEWAGPCPLCGGDDRFHVTADWFFCRQCHEEQGDAIEFVQWLHGISFVEACQRLGADDIPSPEKPLAPAGRRREAATTWNEGMMRELVEKATARLFFTEEGTAGQDYLLGRGLTWETADRYGMGYLPSVALPGTEGKQRARAISIPWFVGGKLRGIRYRFLETHAYTDAKGRQRTEKQTAAAGSTFAGLLFGGQVLAERNTLLLCEGEINAMSIWQASGDSVDVLSLGSEKHHVTSAMVTAIQTRYRSVVVWSDRPEVAARVKEEIPGALGFASAMDANDYLSSGQLAELVAALVARTKRPAGDPAFT